MRTMEEIRASEARGKAAFFAGETDRHPHGQSGRRWVVPPEVTPNMRDARIADFSEWGNLCGWDHDPWVSRKRSRIWRVRSELSQIATGLELLRDRMKRAA